MFRKKVRIKSKRKARLFRRDYKSVGSAITGFEKFVFIVLLSMLCFIIYNIAIGMV
jgi:hypothetical protein